jgi:hypothetical protein
MSEHPQEWRDLDNERFAIAYREVRRLALTLANVLERHDEDDLGIDLIYVGEKAATLSLRAQELALRAEKLLEHMAAEQHELPRFAPAGPLLAAIDREL